MGFYNIKINFCIIIVLFSYYYQNISLYLISSKDFIYVWLHISNKILLKSYENERDIFLSLMSCGSFFFVLSY